MVTINTDFSRLFINGVPQSRDVSTIASQFAGASRRGCGVTHTDRATTHKEHSVPREFTVQSDYKVCL